MSQQNSVSQDSAPQPMSSGSEGEDEPSLVGTAVGELALEAVFKRVKGCRCGNFEEERRMIGLMIEEEWRKIDFERKKLRDRASVLKEASEALIRMFE